MKYYPSWYCDIVVSKGQGQDLLCSGLHRYLGSCSSALTRVQFSLDKIKEQAYYEGVKGEKGGWGVTVIWSIDVG